MEVMILRGLPGSGKSTFAAEIMAKHHYCAVCSADNYFMFGGEYRFDAVKLPLAHDACLRKYVAFLHTPPANLPVKLIVDNTNILVWEIAPYYRLAEVFGHQVKVITFPCEVETAIARNIHAVPGLTILAMAERMASEHLPPWWFHETFSQE